MSETNCPAKRSRREGADILHKIMIPDEVRMLWEFGYVTQAMALNESFWVSDLKKTMWQQLLNDFANEVGCVIIAGYHPVE